MIARADVARFILDALGTREYVGKTVSLGGPDKASGECQDTRRSNRRCATAISIRSVFPESMCPPKLNSVEPPRYGSVCQVVWEGRCREASPYPDLGRSAGLK